MKLGEIVIAGLFVFALASPTSSRAQYYGDPFDFFDFSDCGTLIDHLDMFAASTAGDRESTKLIYVYGGRIVRSGEVEMYVSRIKHYLVERRGVDAKKLKVVFGGYRERAGATLWVVPPGAAVPPADSGVDVKDVKLRKGKAWDREYRCAQSPWR